jgi:hypothetical protein
MTRMFIVALISAIVSAPFALSVQYLIATVLSRETIDEEEAEKAQESHLKRTMSRRQNSVSVSLDLAELCGRSSEEDFKNLKKELSEYYKYLAEDQAEKAEEFQGE